MVKQTGSSRWSYWVGSGGEPQVPDGPQSTVEGFKQSWGDPGKTPGYSQSPWRT